MKSDIIAIQNAILKEFYLRFREYDGKMGLSAPLIPRISPQYLISRTIVIGQETNTWFPNKDISDNLYHIIKQNPNNLEKDCLIDRYDNFIQNHAQKYGGKFWEFNRLLYKENIIEGEMIENGLLSHCWMNIFMTEAVTGKNKNEGRPTKNKKVANQVMELQTDLVSRILNILSPKRIIFLTGHSLDYYIQKGALNKTAICKTPLDEKGILQPHELAIFKIEDSSHFLHSTDIIRAYHPTYFMARINTNKGLRKRLDNNKISDSNSKYYTKALVNYLKMKSL